MKRNTLYIIGGSLLGGIIIYIAINKAIKKNMIKKLYAELEGTTGKSEDKRIKDVLDGKKSATLADAFNPLFYRMAAKAKPGNPITREIAIAKAKAIHNAWGVFDDNEEQVYGALRGLPSKAAVSFVAFWYNKQHDSDLFSDLNYKLTDDEKKVAFGIVEKLRSI